MHRANAASISPRSAEGSPAEDEGLPGRSQGEASKRPDPRLKALDLHRGPASYAEEGSGPPLVLVHGLPGSARDFRWLAPQLAAHFRVIRVELPGFGGTPIDTEPDLSLQARARFVLDVVDALHLDGPLLVGHSMGGIVSCAAVDQEPHAFCGLALLASPGLRPHAMFRRIPFRPLSWILSRPVLGPALTPIVRAVFASMGFRNYPDEALYRTLHCLARTKISEHAEHVRRLKIPTLVAWCDDDALIESQIMAELADQCPAGPRLNFSSGGHNPQKSHAGKIADALTTFQTTIASKLT